MSPDVVTLTDLTCSFFCVAVAALALDEVVVIFPTNFSDLFFFSARKKWAAKYKCGELKEGVWLESIQCCEGRPTKRGQISTELL